VNDRETTLEMWGVAELMGHRRLAGRLTEQTVAGAVFLRIDVPQADGAMLTQLYSASAIYCITPTDEATARAVAAHHQPEPIYRYELLPAGAARSVAPFSEDPSDDGSPF
jgi:hypothetical protein